MCFNIEKNLLNYGEKKIAVKRNVEIKEDDRIKMKVNLKDG